MKKVIVAFITIIQLQVHAQSNDKQEIMKVINQVFDAMRTNDSELLLASFVEEPATYTVKTTKDGSTQLTKGDFQQFVSAVGQTRKDIWNEPIWNEKISIDGNLASVWVDYAFYLSDRFSHCGVDAFHLIKENGLWKIFHLVDTRRKDPCYIPESIDPTKSTFVLNEVDQLKINNLKVVKGNFKHKTAFKVSTIEGDDNDGFSQLKALDFHNGVIEADLWGMPKDNAPKNARGFIGIAFRIGDDDTYECFYLRPTNSIVENQLQRNHSLQYVSHPQYTWRKLRKENPGKYEAYADIKNGEWTKVRIEVNEAKARLFLNNETQPSLIVNDLKLGSDRTGSVGFWTFSSTEAYFANVKVTPTDY